MEGEHPDFDALSTLTVAEGQELTPAEPETPFVILATAAVEGPPRGAVLSHNNLLTAGEQLVAALGLNPEDRHLAALPLYHVTGLGLALATLQAGGANVVMERFDPEPAARMMDQHRVTLMADFPPILATLLDARASSGAEWPDLRYVLGLDAPEVIQRLHAETGAQFWTGFGQSETSGVVTLGAVMEKPGSAGKPLPAAEVRCVDAHGEPVPTGTPGEIAVRGALVFQGYWRDPDASAYAARHGWHHTGDLGRFDEQGYLYYLGRKPEKDLIKSGGENIYPAEVEFAISSLPQVAAVCVIGVPDETWGESVKAVVELQAGADLSADQVIERVAERIASYKKPRTVVFVESLPRTPDGEIDRQAVKSTYT
jgi:long-chain acyl-CoA synthetase